MAINKCVPGIHPVLKCSNLCNLLKSTPFNRSRQTLNHFQSWGDVRGLRQSNVHESAIGMLHGGMQAKAVAAHFGVAASTISRLKGRFNETGRVHDRPRSGRPKKTSAADDRYIVVTSRRNRFMSAPKLTEQFHATSGIRVSTQTVRNRIHKRDSRGRRPYKGIILTTNHARARLNWVTAHRRWTINEWNKLLFNDESRFCVRFSMG